MIKLYKGTLRFDGKLFEFLDRAWLSHYQKDGVMDVGALEKLKTKLGADHLIKDDNFIIFIREIQELEFTEIKSESDGNNDDSNLISSTGIQPTSDNRDVEEDSVPGSGTDGVQTDIRTDNPQSEVSD